MLYKMRVFEKKTLSPGVGAKCTCGAEYVGTVCLCWCKGAVA